MRRLIHKCKFFIKSFFWGLKTANNKILSQSSGNIEDTINNEYRLGGTLYSDLINNELTEQVKKFRDIVYRIYRESYNYKIDINSLRTCEKNGELTLNLENIQLIKNDATNKIPSSVKEDKEYKISVIQPNGEIIESLSESMDKISKGDIINEKKYIIKFITNSFRKFKLEDYTDYVVVKESNKDTTKLKIEFYCISQPREKIKYDSHNIPFIDKSDIFFIERCKEIENDKNKIGDIGDFEKISFITHNAYNQDELFLFEIKIGDLINVFKHKEKYVFSFEGEYLINGEDMIAKYQIESVTEDYKNKTQKSDTLNLGIL